MSDRDELGERTCHVCGVDLDYSLSALVRGYCDACTPNECPECGCETVSQRRTTTPSETAWECDGGCFFVVE